MSDDRTGVRPTFISAAQGFNDLVGQIPADAWEEPALGVWSVRDLVGHTSRALSTVLTYLAKEPRPPHLEDPAPYSLAVRSALADPDSVARRGRDAGHALGENPAAAITTLVHEVIAVVQGSPGAATVTTPVGTMTLDDYLPTRTFELAVHSLDLALAIEATAHTSLGPAVSASCALAGRLAGRLPSAPELLLTLTGRTGHSQDISVV